MSIEPQRNDLRQLPQTQQSATPSTSVEPTPPQRIDTIAQQSLSFPSPLPVSNIAVVPPSTNVLSVHTATHTPPPSPQISAATTTWPTQVSVSSSASSSTPPPVPPVVTAAKNAILEALRSNLEALRSDGDLAPLITTHGRQNFAQAVRLIFKEGLPAALRQRLRSNLRNLTRDTSAYFEGFGHSVLNNEGISTILNYLGSRQTRTGGPLLTMPCSSLHNYDCINAIEHAITQEESSPQTFIVTNRIEPASASLDIDASNTHRTPLLLLPMGNKRFRLLITDSYPGDYNAGLRQDLNNLKIRLEQSGHTLEILFFAEKRQADFTNCPIFSLHDVVRFNTNRVRLQSLIAQTNPNVPVVLPLGFLIPTQSQTTVNRYIETHRENVPFTENAITRFRNRFERALEEGSTQRENRFIDRNMDRYEGIIWEHLLTTATPTSQEATDITIPDLNNLANDRAAQYLNEMANDKAVTFLAQLPTERAATILANPNISGDVRVAILDVLMNNPSTIEKAKAIFAHPNLTITASRDILGRISLEKAIILADATLPLFSKRLLFCNMAPDRAASILTALGTARTADILTTLIAYNAARAIPIFNALPLGNAIEFARLLPPEGLANILSSTNENSFSFPPSYNISLDKTINIFNSITPSAKADILRTIAARDANRAVAIFGNPSLQNATEIFANIASTSLSAVISIIVSFKPTTQAAKFLNASAMAPYRTALIANTTLPSYIAAEILTHADIAVSTAAQIIEDARLPTQRLIEIFSSPRVSQERTIQIMNHICPTDVTTFLAFQLPRDTSAAATFLNTLDARRAALFLTLCPIESQAAILNDNALVSSKASEIFSGYPSDNQATIIDNTNLSPPRARAIFALLPRDKQANIITSYDLQPQRAALLLADPALDTIRNQLMSNISMYRCKDIVAQDELPASIAAELLRAQGTKGERILAQLPVQRANQIRPFM